MSSAERTASGGRLDALDGMRAIAIGGVFLLHAGRAWFPGGAFGVDVFFVLSAFLITSILLRERDRGGVGYRAFYWRRVFRLFPALVVWLALIAAPTAVLAHETHTIAASTFGALFYVNDFLEAWTNHVGAAYDQSWSLAVEEQFYLVWPFLLVLLAARVGPRWLTRTMVAFVGMALVVWLAVGGYFLPTGHLVPLALGCWAACWAAERSRREGRAAAVLADNRLALACLPVFAVALFVTSAGAVGDAVTLAVGVAATVLLLHCVLNADSFVARVLASPVPRWIGVRSYGIYLYGLTLLIAIPLVTHLKLHEALPVDVVVIVAVVGLSYRFVESPVREWGRTWLAEKGEVASSDRELGLVPADRADAGRRARRSDPLSSWRPEPGRQ